MSTPPPPPLQMSTPPPPPTAVFPQLLAAAAPPQPSIYLTNIGLGYSIAIALGFLVLLSTILLASYICCRSRRHQQPNSGPIVTADGSIILQRIIFVAEDDDQDPNAVVGLDQVVINSYPKFQFSRENNNNNIVINFNSSDLMCSICLCEYKDMEMLRMMPECKHYFHLCCIDAWLKLNASCPVCRNSPLPTPLSTPLSEVVPLAQYAADRRRRRS